MPDQISVTYQALGEELQQAIKEKLNGADDDRKFTILLSIFTFLNEVESKPIQDHKAWVKSISEILGIDPELHPAMVDNQYIAYTEALSDFIRSNTHLEKEANQQTNNQGSEDYENSQGINNSHSSEPGSVNTQRKDELPNPRKRSFWSWVLGK